MEKKKRNSSSRKRNFVWWRLRRRRRRCNNRVHDVVLLFWTSTWAVLLFPRFRTVHEQFRNYYLYNISLFTLLSARLRQGARRLFTCTSKTMINTETYQPNWTVRAVTTPTKDTDLCLYVSFDNVRFLFGCGEGTQRAFAQKKIGFSRLGGVFVGSGELKGRGGLPGKRIRCVQQRTSF